MTYEGGDLVGSTLGEVMTVDVDEEGLGWGKYLWVRVNLDITKPLARGRTIRVEGKQSWTDQI